MRFCGQLMRFRRTALENSMSLTETSLFEKLYRKRIMSRHHADGATPAVPAKNI